jgi:hypothetical protein
MAKQALTIARFSDRRFTCWSCIAPFRLSTFSKSTFPSSRWSVTTSQTAVCQSTKYHNMILHLSEPLRHTRTEMAVRHNSPPTTSPKCSYVKSNLGRIPKTGVFDKQASICVIHSAHLQVQPPPTAVLSVCDDSFAAVEIQNMRCNGQQLCMLFVHMKQSAMLLVSM